MLKAPSAAHHVELHATLLNAKSDWELGLQGPEFTFHRSVLRAQPISPSRGELTGLLRQSGPVTHFWVHFLHVPAMIGPMASLIAPGVLQLLAGPWTVFNSRWRWVCAAHDAIASRNRLKARFLRLVVGIEGT